MSCTFESDLTAFVDGELSSLRAKQLETHLSQCAPCRATKALLRRTVEQLKALPAFEPSPAMRRNVLRRIDEPVGLWERLRFRVSSQHLMPAVGLAAAMGLALAIHGATGGPDRMALPDPGQLELAENMDVVADLDVVGVDHPGDVDVIQHLHELEGEP